MSYSTTGNSTYILSKYSRSYPTKRTQHSAQLGPELASDWQHFTNPTIRLVLDVKTARNREIDSVRFRVLWQMMATMDSGDSLNPDVVFEDLDLLSFSPLTSAPSQKTSAEGLPLKVVYRDAVVGIRYLHSRENNVPVYRRMQISFQSTQEASEFIEIIKPICPCKLNPVATGVLPTPRTQMQHTDQQGLSIQASIVPRASPTLQTKASANIPAFVRPDPPVLVAMPQRITAPSMPIAPRSSSPTITSKQASDSSFHISSDDTNGLRPSTSNDMALPLRQKENLVSPHTTQIPSSSVPSSSATSGDLYQSRPHPLVAALNSSTPIYEMSNGALEQLIGEIVHEDGFVQLLERMSQLLTVRTLLDS